MRTVVLLAALALSAAVASTSWAAEPETPEQRKARYLEAKQALNDGRYAEALTTFGELLETARSDTERWRMVLGVALTHELTGRALKSLLHYERFLESSKGHPQAADPLWVSRRKSAEQAARRVTVKVMQSHGRLAFEIRPARAQVALTHAETREVRRLDGRRHAYLTPARYLVEVTHQGYRTRTRDVRVEAGVRALLDFTLEKAPEPVIPQPAPEPQGHSAVWGWVTVATGLALAGTGAVFFGLASEDVNELHQLSKQTGTDAVLERHAYLSDRGAERLTASWVLFGVGGAAVATGIVLALTARPPQAAPAPQPTLSTTEGGLVGGVRAAF